MTIWRLYWKSRSGPRDGSPQTCSILEPLTTLGAPVVRARLYRAEIIPTGMPARSISLAIVAPQRLQVPQVATRMQPVTPALTISWAISLPMRLESATAVPTPLVVKNQGYREPKTPWSSSARMMFSGRM